MTSIVLTHDARQHVRRMLRNAAQLIFSDGRVLAVRLFDISVGGICVISQVNLTKGFCCKISATVLLVPPTPTRLLHQVEVKYAVYSYHDGGFKIGFCFKEADRNLAEAIKAYVAAPVHHG